jgi:ABC-type transport system involved in cytochrome c biogenesis permease subunit
MHLLAFALSFHPRRWLGRAAYATGFALACAAVGYRWWQAQHVPLQIMFEVFLVLGMLMFPLSLLCRKLWGIDGERWDMLLATLVLFPAGFIFPQATRLLPPALQSPLFIPHVMAYMLAYVLMAKATIQAVRQLAAGQSAHAASFETAACRLARLGLLPMTIGLLLGACWGKMAWGRFWNWDPKEMWSLATWLIYIAYFHFRALHGKRFARVNAMLLIAGMVAILFTLLAVTLLLPGLHSYAV